MNSRLGNAFKPLVRVSKDYSGAEETYPCERNTHMATTPANIDDFPTRDAAPRKTLLERIEMAFHCTWLSMYQRVVRLCVRTSRDPSHRTCKPSRSLRISFVKLEQICSVPCHESIFLPIGFRQRLFDAFGSLRGCLEELIQPETH
jgi:hypothetical protein